ncbi:hypothetical protein BDP55DRAFT_706805 [Colletotrichum godetiae]|uniref:MYND-type zinc finger protein samB n=1 Tax=Colletotrichum godetiae TaxID=1209918 RepID=A0AAJ0AFH7_9PEZI|nr:uncharacterized protein BDP55DRAFT_706805 [Colletotrichum godetiae]KAK1671518.1 hypothetical protein BDP55DRAFT_706805 [Colletotrichum godetiae]
MSSCTVCKRGPPQITLRNCAKCSTIPYCSRDYQPINRPFTKLDNGTWLHDRPEADVYRLLVDAYRLRVEDYIYGGAEDGLEGFRRVMKKAAKRKGLLPAWWCPKKQAACERLDGAEGDDGDDDNDDYYYDLGSAVEKADIIERYGNPRFPIQLRIFAEAVNLRGPGGQDGSSMRKMMASMEGGAYGSAAMRSTIDTTTMNRSDFRS